MRPSSRWRESIAAGGSLLAGTAGAILLGSRNTLYGLRLADVLRPRWPGRLLPALGVIDETTAVSLAQPDPDAARTGFTATFCCLYLTWNLATLAGAVGAGRIGSPQSFGLDVVGPAAFLALIWPRLRTGRDRAARRRGRRCHRARHDPAAAGRRPGHPGRDGRARRRAGQPGGAAADAPVRQRAASSQSRSALAERAADFAERAVTGVWIAVLATAAGCYALKLAGLTVPQRVLASPRVRRFAELVPVALLMALSAVQTATSGHAFALDPARLAGLGAAVVALLLRAPFLLVIVAAAGTAAALRAAGIS